MDGAHSMPPCRALTGVRPEPPSSPSPGPPEPARPEFDPSPPVVAAAPASAAGSAAPSAPEAPIEREEDVLEAVPRGGGGDPDAGLDERLDDVGRGSVAEIGLHAVVGESTSAARVRSTARGRVLVVHGEHHLAGRRHQLVHGAGGDGPAEVHDDDVRAGLLHLGQQVAGDQHGAAGGRVAAQHLAHGVDLRRVEPVGRLVHQQQVRQPEHRLGDRQPLPHALRVGADPAVDGRAEPGDLQRLVQVRVLCGPAGGLPVQLEVRLAGQVRQEARIPRRSCRCGTGSPTRAGPCGRRRGSRRRWGRSAPSPSAAWWSCRRRSGPSRPSTWPCSTRKLTSVTACTPPGYDLPRPVIASGTSTRSGSTSDRRERTMPPNTSPRTAITASAIRPISWPTGISDADTRTPPTSGALTAPGRRARRPPSRPARCGTRRASSDRRRPGRWWRG